MHNIKAMEKKKQTPLYGGSVLRLNTAMTKQKAEKTASQVTTFDDLLVAVGQTQNRDAFIRLFEYFAPRVKSFLMKGGLSPDVADELAQETMLSVWDKAESYSPKRASASTWIYTVARNKRIDFLRKRSRSEAQMDDTLQITDESTEKPDAAAERNETEETIATALSQLPEDQADLIEKAFFEHKTHQEIAAETGLPLGTVKSRIRLALERLRHGLGGKDL